MALVPSNNSWIAPTRTLWDSVGRTGWTSPNPLSKSQRFPASDWGHIFHFSVSALWWILIFAPPHQTKSQSVKSYCNHQGVYLSLTNLTGRLVLLTQVMFHGEYSLNAKAWNGRVICSWLSETMPIAARGLPAGHDGGRVSLVCHALNLICDIGLFHKFWGCGQYENISKQCYHRQFLNTCFLFPGDSPLQWMHPWPLHFRGSAYLDSFGFANPIRDNWSLFGWSRSLIILMITFGYFDFSWVPTNVFVGFPTRLGQRMRLKKSMKKEGDSSGLSEHWDTLASGWWSRHFWCDQKFMCLSLDFIKVVLKSLTCFMGYQVSHVLPIGSCDTTFTFWIQAMLHILRDLRKTRDLITSERYWKGMSWHKGI